MLKQQIYFLCSGDGKAENHMPVWSGSGEHSLSGVQTLLTGSSSGGQCREGKGTSHGGGPTLMTAPHPDHPKASFPNTIHHMRGLGISMWLLGGHILSMTRPVPCCCPMAPATLLPWRHTLRKVHVCPSPAHLGTLRYVLVWCA